MTIRLLSLCGLMLLLAGCGGGGSGDNDSPTAADRVSVTASAPSAFAPSGGSIPIEVVVANPGTKTSTEISATLALGNGLTKGTVSCVARSGAVCPSNLSDLAIPSLPAGASLQFTINALVAPNTRGPITSTVSVSAAGDAVTTNNTASVQLTAFVADVLVTSASAGAQFFSGSLATYSMTLSNLGPDDAHDLKVQDVVGSGQELSSLTCTAAGGATCPSLTTGSATIPTLANGGSLTFTVIASIATTTVGPIHNTLQVSADGDPVTGNNAATETAATRIPTSPQSSSFVSLRSDSGDFIGAGKSYDYNRANAVIKITATGGTLQAQITGDENWTGSFVLPGSQSQLSPGAFPDVPRDAPLDPALGGMSWFGEGRGCNLLTGSITVDSVTYVAGSLAALDLRFEQHCGGGEGPALHGQIHWVANDNLNPPGPVNPPPAGLWSPASGATPATGNYVYLQSDGGDFVGQGRTFTYTQANAVLALTLNGNHLSVGVSGAESWGGDFKAMDIVTTLQPGYYGNLQRFPFHNPTTGGLSWSGLGGCNELTGWFVIDSITVSSGALISLDLRFEQHCEGRAPALRGKIHWTTGDTTQPNGPQVPPPTNLWAPAAGVTPATGNYVYLQSSTNDYIGAGRTYSYTQSTAVIKVISNGPQLAVNVNGAEQWSGAFEGMSSLAQLQPGYYPDLRRFPFHNPAKGGLSWTGENRGCNELTGWFVIDSITFAGNMLDSVDLRFEQNCDGGPPLHGKVHWTANDTTQPPGPQNPPPSNLWAPAAGETPASGNYVYLASDAGDYIGLGQTYTATQPAYTIDLSANGGSLSVAINGAAHYGMGQFEAMSSISQFQPGYYPDLERALFHNPVKGGLSWIGDSRACNTLTGWLVVDSVTYTAGTLASIDLRFEQHCEGAAAALHGKIHWAR